MVTIQCQTVKEILAKIRVMKTNLRHYLSSVYFVSQPLRVLGMFVAQYQEVYFIYTTVGSCCDFWLTVCWPACFYLATYNKRHAGTGVVHLKKYILIIGLLNIPTAFSAGLVDCHCLKYKYLVALLL
jgi:hypothetical protein